MKAFTREEKTKHPEMIEYYEKLVKEGTKPNKAERKAREKFNISKH